MARLGDGWLASAYNTTPAQLMAGRQLLDAELARRDKQPSAFPTALATMWTYVTEDARERDDKLSMIASMLNRPPEVLAGQILVGPAEECAAKLRAYSAAGVNEVFIWPLADDLPQIERFITAVVPHVAG